MRWIFFPSIKDLIENTTLYWNFLAKVSVCTYVKFSIILGNNRTKKQKLRGHFALLAVIWHRTLSRNRGDFSNLQCSPKMENKCKNNNYMSSSCSNFESSTSMAEIEISIEFFFTLLPCPNLRVPFLWSKSFEKKMSKKIFF